MNGSAPAARRTPPGSERRPRRRLTPAVAHLEDRRLLTAGPAATATATMSQTATFFDLESHPGLADQSILYFAATMGTLTEVDVVTSGSFTTGMSVENLAPAPRTIAATTSADLSIRVPTGAIPVAIPSVTRSLDATAFDGTVDYGGTSGEAFAPVTSTSAPQTMVLTAPADLAAFTGHFRIPIGVTGQAAGSTNPDDAQVADAFSTQTSATITVVYHYIPTLPAPEPGNPGPSGPSPSSPTPLGGTSVTPPSSMGAVRAVGGLTAAAVGSDATGTHGKAGGTTRPRIPHHPHPAHRHAARQSGVSRRPGLGLGLSL